MSTFKIEKKVSWFIYRKVWRNLLMFRWQCIGTEPTQEQAYQLIMELSDMGVIKYYDDIITEDGKCVNTEYIKTELERIRQNKNKDEETNC